jgi:hypothetical protein
MGCNSRNRRNSYHCPDHGIGRLIWLNTRYDERGLCADCRDILTTAQWKHGMASVFDETGSYSRRCGCQWRAGRSVGAYVCSPVFKPQFCHKGLRPATICGFGPPLCWSEQGSNPGSRVRERDGEDSGIRARAMNGGDAVSQIRVRFLVLRFIRFIHRDAPVLVFPAREAVTQLASTNMVTISAITFSRHPVSLQPMDLDPWGRPGPMLPQAPEFDRVCGRVPSDSPTPAALWVPACAGMAKFATRGDESRCSRCRCSHLIKSIR